MNKKYGTLTGLLLIIMVITYSCTTDCPDNTIIKKTNTNTIYSTTIDSIENEGTVEIDKDNYNSRTDTLYHPITN